MFRRRLYSLILPISYVFRGLIFRLRKYPPSGQLIFPLAKRRWSGI